MWVGPPASAPPPSPGSQVGWGLDWTGGDVIQLEARTGESTAGRGENRWQGSQAAQLPQGGQGHRQGVRREVGSAEIRVELPLPGGAGSYPHFVQSRRMALNGFPAVSK